MLGPWWSEGFEFVFTWRDGALQARRVIDPTGRPPAVFGPSGGSEDGVLRTISGREVGELLRLHRDPATGVATHMHWATYLLTRGQQTFDHVPVSQP